MSKWGFVPAESAKRKFKNRPTDAGEMVEDMSQLILAQEKEIDELKTKIMGLSAARMADHGAVERLLGWQERVREVDAPLEKP